MPTPELVSIGEAVTDIVETGDDDARLARPGGSPYNVAIGLGRLGRQVAYVGRLSRDPLGRMLRAHAERSSVDLSLAVAADQPSTVAFLTVDQHGGAQYRFGIEGSADFAFTAEELERVPLDVPAVHFGSLTSWLAPGDAVVASRVAALGAAGATVSYDPNVRPQLQPDPVRARAQVEAAVGLAHLVKTSDEDLAWTHPGEAAVDVARDWLTRGASIVVITHGRDGAAAVTSRGIVAARPPAVDVVDTVGAGDAFMAGLLDALIRRELLTPRALLSIESGALREALQDAALVAAVTCARAGANPPRRADLDAFR